MKSTHLSRYFSLLNLGRIAAALFTIFALTTLVSGSAMPSESHARAVKARVLARNELDAIHATLVDGHPGAIDELNPGYRERIEAGYRAAIASVPEVQDAHDAMSLADRYVASFRDGHLSHSNDVIVGDRAVVNGWRIARSRDGRLRVKFTLPDWPVALPPIGAEWTGCDGRSPEQLIAQDVLPYLPILSQAHRDHWVWTLLARPAMTTLQASICTFRLPDQSESNFVQRYQSVGASGFDALFRTEAEVVRPRPINDMALLPDGTLWIRAGNFMLDTQGEAQLEALIEQLKVVRGAKRIVFDTRGNQGGNSDVGDRIFGAATGGLAYDTENLDALPRLQAFWRVSPIAIRAIDFRITMLKESLGANSPQAIAEVTRQTEMRDALARGEHWLPQDAGSPALSPAELAWRGAHMNRFSGSVALLTDSDCASACLDFADLVRSVPGALHLGETTRFDSVYIDIGAVPLPSGNMLVLPLKVWRHRVRGNDQPWVPEISIAVSGRNDVQVRAEVLAALTRLRQHSMTNCHDPSETPWMMEDTVGCAGQRG